MIKGSANPNVDSSIITLSKIVDKRYKYQIPLYQRLYVWGDDQVQMLLEDIERACIEKQTHYYIGGVMTTPSGSDSHLFYLIDGQQRFTTLWLICNELKGELLNFTHIEVDNKEKASRLSFAIRDFANLYFTHPENYSSFTKEEIAELSKIKQAQQMIKSFFEGKDNTQFIDFLYNKVNFIQTRMPLGIDENRLFEVLNNRGIQLQHHEILKARFLELLNDDERHKYGILWEACSNMDNYVEKNIKELTGLTWEVLMQSDTNSDIDTEINLPDNILDKISNSTTREEISLLEILNKGVYHDNKIVKDEYEYEYDSGKVRSIISFPMFLLHSLRVYLSDFDIHEENVPEVNEKKLLVIFKKHFFDTPQRDNAKSFIELLWKLRVKFDDFVIKWVDVGNNEEHHLIKKLYSNKKILQRRLPENNCGFTLLQSMLYHSQQIVTLYWLTPFLKKILLCNDMDELYLFLRKIDNQMFSGVNKASLSLRSWHLTINKQLAFESGASVLSLPKGTGFGSYWFYRNDFQNEKNNEFKEWDNYRMTKKNSVEHISPQTPREYDTNKLWLETEVISEDIKRERLDNFGHLVLLSVGLNSEYSNKTFSEKKTTFTEKKRLDSLKSDLIFKYEHWNWQNCKEHRDRMIQLFNKYLSEQL